MTFANEEQAEFWSEIAPTWVELEDDLEMVGGPPGRMAMDRLGLTAGQQVIDVGCGTGSTSIELSQRVVTGGAVLGVDISDGMVARAREKAVGVRNVRFLQADVQVHDLGEGRFDAAFSRFGVMFFDDPVAAFANIRRALRADGRLSFCSWLNVFANEWLLLPGAAVASVTGTMPQMPEPGAPGPFSLSDPELVKSVLDGAGFHDIDIDPQNDFVSLAEPDIPARARASIRVGAARESLRDADDAMRAAALAAIEDAFRSRLEGGAVNLTRGFLLASARA